MWLSALGVVLFLFALYMLVRSAQYRRQEAKRHPEAARQGDLAVARVFIPVAVIATPFPFLLFAQGFVLMGGIMLGLVAALWLLVVFVKRRTDRW